MADKTYPFQEHADEIFTVYRKAINVVKETDPDIGLDFVSTQALNLTELIVKSWIDQEV